MFKIGQKSYFLPINTQKLILTLEWYYRGLYCCSKAMILKKMANLKVISAATLRTSCKTEAAWIRNQKFFKSLTEETKTKMYVSTKHLQPNGVHFYEHALTLITTWISNHMPNKVWAEITYPFPNYSSSIIISPYTSMLGFKLIHVSKRGP